MSKNINRNQTVVLLGVILIIVLLVPVLVTSVASAAHQALFTLYHPLFYNPGSLVIVQNLEATSAQSAYSIYDEGGAAVYASSVDTISPGELVKIDAENIAGLSDGLYSLLNNSDRKTQSLVVTQDSNPDGDNLAMYLSDSEPYTATLVAPVYKDYSGYDSTIWVQNASPGQIDVDIQFYNSSGQAIAQSSINLSASNVSKPLDVNEIPGLPAGFIGWVEIVSSGNMVSIVEQRQTEVYEIDESLMVNLVDIYNSPGQTSEYALPRLFKAYNEGAGPRTSQVLLLNPGDVDATLAITFTNSVNDSFSAPLNVISSKEMLLIDLADEEYLDNEEVYSAIVTSDVPIGVSEVTHFNFNPLPAGSYKYAPTTEQNLPRLIQKDATYSVFSIQNPSTSTAEGVILYTGTSSGQTSFAIQPGGFLRLKTTEISLLDDNFEGLATITSSQPVAVQVDEYIVTPNPLPSITSLSPNSAKVGSPSLTLTVNGSNFMDASTVQWDGSPITTTYMNSAQLQATVDESKLVTPQTVAVTVENPPPGGGTSNSINFTVTDKTFVYLPLSIKNWPPQAVTPQLQAINNADQDNIYSVNWANPSPGATYILEEAWNADFTNAGLVYQGTSLSWTVPTGGKLPGTYFYQVKARNAYNESPWSTAQSIRIYPLYVGLQASWDGKGFIRTDDYFDVGTHDVKKCDLLTDPETIRCTSTYWYSPNPEGWASENWNTYYSVITGGWKGDDYIDDPSWKWGNSWKLAYDSYFNDGTTVKIDGQQFTVTGPHWGYTTYGKAIQYWEFINQNKFLYNDSGGDWAQYVHPGDVILRYDAGGSGLILYESILRHYYYQDELSPYTVQYITTLTAATSLPGSPPVATLSSVTPLLEQPSFFDSNSLEDGLEFGLPRD